MASSLYLIATEDESGKSAVAFGLMELLLRKTGGAAFFRPIASAGDDPEGRDHDIDLIASHYHLDTPYEEMYGLTETEVRVLLSRGGRAEVLDAIMAKFHRLRDAGRFVLCEGTDFAGSMTAFEFDVNAELSRNLGSPVLLVAKGLGRSPEEVLRSTELTLESLQGKGCPVTAIIVNRVDPRDAEATEALLRGSRVVGDTPLWLIPEDPELSKPTVGEVARALEAAVLYGGDQLGRHVRHFTVAAMQLPHFLERVEEGSLVITPGDRADILIACLAAASSSSMENIAGIVLTGGLLPEEPIRRLIEGFPSLVPVLSVAMNTFPAARAVDEVKARISADDARDVSRVLGLFEGHVDVERLSERIVTSPATVVTPKMFEFEVIQKARRDRRHIVLAEGEEERILRAAEIILRRGVASLTLLGDPQRIGDTASRLGLDIAGAAVVDPARSPLFDGYAREYFELRRHRGVTEESARDAMGDVNYFGTMMIHREAADGMVSGAVHSTASTIRPGFEFLKTAPGFSIVSSVFFMCLPDRVLVYGDCAVNPNPTAPQLAEIALASARTAETFGVEPVVAMLSYSSGESGTGEDVERVREATSLARQRAAEVFPGLQIEGPIQYDAAVSPEVARVKMPGSPAAGRATVFIFPDLNTGNNTYKAVQRSAGAVAVGPVLQGLRKPVNDLSRGCTVTDIVNTVAITAIQAQGAGGR